MSGIFLFVMPATFVIPDSVPGGHPFSIAKISFLYYI